MSETALERMDEFPPTVVDHFNDSDGIELSLLDSGTRENPRYIWIPDDPDAESVFALDPTEQKND